MAENFAAMVEAAEPGGTIEMPAGTYVLSELLRIDKVGKELLPSCSYLSYLSLQLSTAG